MGRSAVAFKLWPTAHAAKQTREHGYAETYLVAPPQPSPAPKSGLAQSILTGRPRAAYQTGPIYLVSDFFSSAWTLLGLIWMILDLVLTCI